MNVLVITGHLKNAKNKAGFHHVISSLEQTNIDLTILSFPVPLNELFRSSDNASRDKYKWFHLYVPFRPVHLRYKFVNWGVLFFSKLLAKLYGFVFFSFFNKNYDRIIIESGYCLYLINRPIKNCKITYRVSDSPKSLRLNEDLINREARLLPFFDKVSVPSLSIYSYYDNLIASNNTTLKFEKHGIFKKDFDEKKENPYIYELNAVFVGMRLLDITVIEILSRRFDDVHFHIIGDFDNAYQRPNVHYYGVMDYKDTCKYIKFATVGLACFIKIKGIEDYSETNKIVQYSYCGLPIFMPCFIPSKRKNIFHYQYVENSMVSSFKKALVFENKNLYSDDLDWTELSNLLLDI
jgi:2-beta-glucuronyltransferase